MLAMILIGIDEFYLRLLGDDYYDAICGDLTIFTTDIQ